MVRGYVVKSKMRNCTESWSSRCLGDEGERALSGQGGGGNLCIERKFRLFVGYVTNKHVGNERGEEQVRRPRVPKRSSYTHLRGKKK